MVVWGEHVLVNSYMIGSTRVIMYFVVSCGQKKWRPVKVST